MTEIPATLAAALAAFQAQLPDVRKTETAKVATKTGRDYQYLYADLADVSKAVLPKLGLLGLSWITCPTVAADGKFVLAYKLLHVSGQEITGEYPMQVGDAQAMGSAITYARRYALCAVTGVMPDADDDGAAATRATRSGRPAADEWDSAKPAARGGATARPVEDRQRARMFALFAKLAISDRAKQVEYMEKVVGHEVKSRADLSADEAALVIRTLEVAADDPERAA